MTPDSAEAPTPEWSRGGVGAGRGPGVQSGRLCWPNRCRSAPSHPAPNAPAVLHRSAHFAHTVAACADMSPLCTPEVVPAAAHGRRAAYIGRAPAGAAAPGRPLRPSRAERSSVHCGHPASGGGLSSMAAFQGHRGLRPAAGWAPRQLPRTRLGRLLTGDREERGQADDDGGRDDDAGGSGAATRPVGRCTEFGRLDVTAGAPAALLTRNKRARSGTPSSHPIRGARIRTRSSP